MNNLVDNRLGVWALAALVLVQSSAAALAEPTRLECTLSRLQTKSGQNFESAVENRSLSVTYDEEGRSLKVDRDGKTYSLGHITMTPISITGYVDDISLGVDRSSWSVVLQTFGSSSTTSEFGTCGKSTKSSP